MLTQHVSYALVVHVVTFVCNSQYFNSAVYIGLPSSFICCTVEHVTSCQLRHCHHLFATITQHQTLIPVAGTIWLSESVAGPQNVVTGVLCRLCGGSAATTGRSSVLGIPEDLSHHTCVFVASERWPRNLAENITTVVTGTIRLGVLYVLKKKRTPRQQTSCAACYPVLG